MTKYLLWLAALLWSQSAVTNRRQWLSGLAGAFLPRTQNAVLGFHISGRLLDDTSDLQPGYFHLCGSGTGQCKATEAIGISVHPHNTTVFPKLQALVGQDVELAIHPVHG